VGSNPDKKCFDCGAPTVGRKMRCDGCRKVALKAHAKKHGPRTPNSTIAATLLRFRDAVPQGSFHSSTVARLGA
jgi:hypothetical protein